jgi:hypothetical protein
MGSGPKTTSKARSSRYERVQPEESATLQIRLVALRQGIMRQKARAGCVHIQHGQKAQIMGGLCRRLSRPRLLLPNHEFRHLSGHGRH